MLGLSLQLNLSKKHPSRFLHRMRGKVAP